MEDRSSLCRIKVNKMLSSLNLNNNIFVPKYTISSKNEEKYSFINKSKEKSVKVNHSNIMKNNNSNVKESKNKITIETTEENYTKQPIDFIINHGVLVYQRNLKGEEIINLGINNEYLRKNNFKIDSNCIKQSFSNNKNIKLNNSKKSLFSMNDIHNLKNKNNSYCRNKIFGNNNLNSTLNSNSSVNSMSINNIKINYDKNKLNKTHTSLNLNNKKNVINYVRKKKNSNENGFRLIRKKKNYGASINDENVMLNNEKCIKDTCNLKKKIKFSPKKQKHNFIINNNFKISKLIHSLYIAKRFYIKKYYKIFISNLSKKVNDIINNLNNKIEETDKNKAIDENRRNSTYNQEHKKLNSILVNKTLSSKTTNANEYQSNSNKNLSSLISKNLRFFSKDKDNNNRDESIKERRPSELFRDSKSLKKKFEQICRRRRKEKTLIFPNRYKDTNSPMTYFSDSNKTNSFSNLYENNSVNSFQIKNDYNYNFNQLYKDNSIDNENNKENRNNNIIITNTNETSKNLIEYKNENSKRIKLVKNKEKSNTRFNKYIISNNIRNKNNSYNHFGQNNESMKDNEDIKKNSFSINNKKNINNNSISNKNKNIFKKVFIHKRKNCFLEDNNMLKIKEKIMKRNNTYNNSNDPYNFKNKHIALLIKNICTKDRRIFVHITYIPLVLTSNNNYKKYNCNLLKVENIFSYNYMNKKKKIKRNNEFEKKLSLIREEDEKSKNLNSTKSSIKLEEDLNSNIRKANNIRITKNIGGNYLNIVKIVNLLEKDFGKYHKGKKKEFILNLKIIFLFESIKKIIQRKTKNTFFIKYIKKINEQQQNNDIYNNEKDQNYLDDNNINKNILISHNKEI